MPFDLTVSFFMSIVFTGGAIAIRNLDRHAKQVEEVLVLILFLCFSVCAYVSLGYYVEYYSFIHTNKLREMYISQFNDDEIFKWSNAGYD